ncbi:MAG TPA: energy transducer TonB, partial [Burkholderiales bacterium]|nr:energy transducer TonB [Burkholderiales bacterium]
MAFAVGLHALAVYLVLQLDPVRAALTQAAPVMVRLVAPPQPKLEESETPPKPLPVKPRVVRAKPKPAPPVMTAVSEAAAPFVAPRPPPEPLIEAPPEPAPAAPPAPPVVVAAAPAPTPLIPPRFNADYLKNPAPAYPALSRRMR